MASNKSYIVVHDTGRLKLMTGATASEYPYDIDFHQFLMDNNISHYVSQETPPPTLADHYVNVEMLKIRKAIEDNNIIR